MRAAARCLQLRLAARARTAGAELAMLRRVGPLLAALAAVMSVVEGQALWRRSPCGAAWSACSGGTGAPLDRRPIQLLPAAYRLWAACRAAWWRPCLWRARVPRGGREAAADCMAVMLGLAVDMAGPAVARLCATTTFNSPAARIRNRVAGGFECIRVMRPGFPEAAGGRARSMARQLLLDEAFQRPARESVGGWACACTRNSSRNGPGTAELGPISTKLGRPGILEHWPCIHQFGPKSARLGQFWREMTKLDPVSTKFCARGRPVLPFFDGILPWRVWLL